MGLPVHINNSKLKWANLGAVKYTCYLHVTEIWKKMWIAQFIHTVKITCEKHYKIPNVRDNKMYKTMSLDGNKVYMQK